MQQLRELLARLRDALSRDKGLLTRAQRKVRRHDRAARDAQAQAEAEEKKRQFWVGRVKALHARRHQTADRIGATKAKIKELKNAGVKIEGNTVTGGTPGKRFVAAVLASVAYDTAHANRFYSQSGAWTVAYPITGEPHGYRSDCSQWLLSIIHACGLPDPGDTDFTGGYTGTLVLARNGWKQVSLATLQAHGWGYVVYGGGVGHHTEAHIGPGDRTGGHGDARVNYGVDNLFGDGDFRCFIYDPN